MLVRSESAAGRMRLLDVEPMLGDITDRHLLADGMAGCRVVFHVAGLNAMCLHDPSALDRVNVDGTRAVVGAATAAGVERVVYTSSAAAIGEAPGTVGTESTPHRGWYLTAYERSKHLAEIAAFEEGESKGLDVVAVNPSSVQGPGRTEGTARILLSYLRGRLRFGVDTRMSLVFIDDVVEAHLGAERAGRPGERYLVSGWTATVAEVVSLLAATADVEHRVRYVPPWLLAGAGRAVGGWYRLIGRDAPLCTEMVRTLRHGHTYDGSRIEQEWGFSYTSPDEWLRQTVEWYRDEGMV